jgi:hypothetical protein
VIAIPDGASVADVVGETDILAGQGSLSRKKLIRITTLMLAGTFDWDKAQEEEPMSFQQGSNGLVLNQGHHRWIAARLAGVEIPVTILVYHDYLPGPVTFARDWNEVVWE